MLPQLTKNVRVADKAAVREHPVIQSTLTSVRSRLGERGRILLRESGTEPVIRVMVEAGSNELCEELVDSVIDVIKKKGHLA
jgi:phosphoglucosamine mutase